jgi:hypothetical protein
MALAAPQPDDSYPLPIAPACDMVTVAYRYPPWLTGNYHLRSAGPVVKNSVPHSADSELVGGSIQRRLTVRDDGSVAEIAAC